MKDHEVDQHTYNGDGDHHHKVSRHAAAGFSVWHGLPAIAAPAGPLSRPWRGSGRVSASIDLSAALFASPEPTFQVFRYRPAKLYLPSSQVDLILF
jgi:hypothetical protein